MNNDYGRNVFINCPFDRKYSSLLRPILFTIIYLGFLPRISLERFDSGEPRFNKICELIKQSKYGIHDLSRIQARRKGEYFRLNMPFELGLDIGCRVFQRRKYSDKQCLILEEKNYRYQAAISDLSNSDIKSHKNNPMIAIRQIRNWFVENGLEGSPSGTVIWYKFTDFMTDFHEKREAEGFEKDDIYKMPIPEYTHFIRTWIKLNPPQDRKNIQDRI
ncbi:MAG TPA: hypothetical protein VFD10_08210 [Atribacterota bacterium]|nr:hypothetical protein [Atribacterota bacterium]